MKKTTIALALSASAILTFLGAARATAQTALTAAQLATQAKLSPAQLEAELRAPQPPKDIHHDFIAIDEGLGTILRINENDPTQNWRVTGLAQARDMQLIGHGRLLVSYDNGYAEIDIATGKFLKKYSGLVNVAAARRQPDGSTLLAGVDLAGAKGVCVLHLDASDKVIENTVYPGDYVRLLRQTAQGTYLMCNNTEIREASPDGKILRTFPVEGFRHAWKAVRLDNNQMVAAAGYGAFMVDLDANGNVVRKFADKGSLPADFNRYFAAYFQILPNGNIVQANWQNHGPTHGASGVQLFEVDPSGKVVWQWSRAALISSLQGITVLDGLDLSRLHDERTGLMLPMDTTPPSSTVSEVVYSGPGAVTAADIAAAAKAAKAAAKSSKSPKTEAAVLAAADAEKDRIARLVEQEEARKKAYESANAQAAERIAEINAKVAQADERDIAAAVERLRKAMLASDGAELSDIAGENLLYCHSSGKQQNKKEFVDTIVQGHSVFLTLEFSEQVIKITGDTAIVHNRFISDTHDDGKPGHTDLGVLLVWKKTAAGQWKLIGRQAFKIP